MEFGFNEEQENFRKEMHEFFINELPEDFQPGQFPPDTRLEVWSMEFQKKIQREKRWLTPGWPKEYGGLGLGWVEQSIANEERGYWGVTYPDNMGYSMIGPAVILFGNEEQKREVLPRITSGEGSMWQCFTEPDAGSDEANVQLRAVEDGDYYILNGQKTFIGEQFKPQLLYTLARTADTTPKHRGISLFLIPVDTPGVSTRPLPVISGQTKNEVFYDNVRIPKSYLLGELNRGFYHAMQTFEFERTGTGRAAGVKREFEEFVQFCKETKRNGKPLIEDPHVRDTLGKIAIEVELLRLACWHTAWGFANREKLGRPGPSLVGTYHKVWSEPHYEAMMNIMGLYGQLIEGSKWAKLAGRLQRRWQWARSTHGGGTIEIYKVVLAERGLGLPRIPGSLRATIGQAVKEASARR